MRVAVSFGDLAKLAPYEAALRELGLDPVRNPDSLEGLDGLLLTGGTDVDPALYGEEKRVETQEPDRVRDAREARLVHEAIGRDLPVLAICRGLQMLNVALGGTLVQHLANATEHQVQTPDDPSRLAHNVVVASGTILSSAMGAGEHPVNSRHHQAIAKPAPCLQITASAPQDGVVEAAEVPELRFVVGVQWHPEDRIRCEADRRLFERFARAVAGF